MEGPGALSWSIGSHSDVQTVKANTYFVVKLLLLMKLLFISDLGPQVHTYGVVMRAIASILKAYDILIPPSMHIRTKTPPPPHHSMYVARRTWWYGGYRGVNAGKNS